MARHPSHRPPASEPQRELSMAGRLEPLQWTISVQALAEFRKCSYSVNEVEQALSDAVRDKRFTSAAVFSQRHNVKLYFAVTRLMMKRRLQELPWPQRELGRLLHEFEKDPSIRGINVDFAVMTHKMIRNGAFDHLAGLTTTIVSIQYLPGVRKLMDRKYVEPVMRQPDIPRPLARTGTISPRRISSHAFPSPISTSRFPPVQLPVDAIKSATPSVKSSIPASRLESSVPGSLILIETPPLPSNMCDSYPKDCSTSG